MNRRNFIHSSLLSGSLLAAGQLPARRAVSYKLKLSCNLYSFNAPLRSGEMSLEEVIDYCTELGFDAVDPTGYYFPGYPEPPADAYVYALKRRAFLQGLDISGTGIRNDFTVPEVEKRETDIELIKAWVHVAAKMDAPVLRVFTGRQNPEGYTRDQVLDWMVDAYRTVAEYAGKNGVMIVLQNHNEFLKTADGVLDVLERVDSEWFGLNLDIGSLPMGDPYEEIATLAPYACTWQIKENINRNGKQEKTDLNKIVDILKSSGYRGYIPIETLGEGDPRIKVKRFLDEVSHVLA